MLCARLTQHAAQAPQVTVWLKRPDGSAAQEQYGMANYKELLQNVLADNQVRSMLSQSSLHDVRAYFMGLRGKFCDLLAWLPKPALGSAAAVH